MVVVMKKKEAVVVMKKKEAVVVMKKKEAVVVMKSLMTEERKSRMIEIVSSS
jgi:hypothetical protein